MSRGASLWVKRGLALSFLTIFAAASSLAEIPRKAPEFAIELPDGGQKLLSQYRGKVVVLEIMVTTCPHCQHASTVMEKLRKELGPKGFQPLAAAVDDNAQYVIPSYVQKFNVGFPIGTTTHEQAYDFLKFRFRFVPQLIVIDRNGVIRYQLDGGDPADRKFFDDEEGQMRQIVESLLKEPAGGTTQSAAAHRGAKSR